VVITESAGVGTAVVLFELVRSLIKLDSNELEPELEIANNRLFDEAFETNFVTLTSTIFMLSVL
jgi:hypothetical protein